MVVLTDAHHLGGGFRYYFHPYLGKSSHLMTNIFQSGWNHQLVMLVSFIYHKVCPVTSYKWSETTPISRVISPVTHLFSAIYRGYNTIYNW